MTKKQAQFLMEDLGKSLSLSDYTENVYMSIRGVGTKVFRQCAFFEADGYTFIWTMNDKFLINNKELGDFVVVPLTHQTVVSLKKVT
jgi:hypothetical protein